MRCRSPPSHQSTSTKNGGGSFEATRRADSERLLRPERWIAGPCHDRRSMRVRIAMRVRSLASAAAECRVAVEVPPLETNARAIDAEEQRVRLTRREHLNTRSGSNRHSHDLATSSQRNVSGAVEGAGHEDCQSHPMQCQSASRTARWWMRKRHDCHRVECTRGARVRRCAMSRQDQLVGFAGALAAERTTIMTPGAWAVRSASPRPSQGPRRAASLAEDHPRGYPASARGLVDSRQEGPCEMRRCYSDQSPLPC